MDRVDQREIEARGDQAATTWVNLTRSEDWCRGSRLKKRDGQDRVLRVYVGARWVVEVLGPDLCFSRRGVEEKDSTRSIFHVVNSPPW